MPVRAEPSSGRLRWVIVETYATERGEQLRLYSVYTEGGVAVPLGSLDATRLLQDAELAPPAPGRTLTR